MTIAEILRNSQLSPLDAELLLSYALKKSREYLLSHPEKRLKNEQMSKFNRLSKRSESGEPIAYILGKKEFYGLEFTVSRDVLIPRPETELLVELAIKNILNTKYPAKGEARSPRWSFGEAGQRRQIPDTIIDIGTGSGNIIISIVKNIPQKIRKKINFYAVDISENALKIAQSNAKRYKLGKIIKFIKSDLLDFSFRKKLYGNVLIVANLPYVSPKLYKKYQKNLKYEPRSALASKKGGLEHYSRLFKQIKQILTMRYVLCAMCYVEISPEQKNEISKIIRKHLSRSKHTFSKDLSRRTRAMVIWTNQKACL